MDVDQFLAEYNEKYEKIMHLQNLLNHISKETFQETIKFVEDNLSFFLKTRESAFLFLWNIKIFTYYNFTKLKLILDVFLYFSNYLKEVNITDTDVIDTLEDILVDIYYFYSQNFITLKSIIQKSVYNSVYFLYFYPEIDEYDHEYAEKRKDNILKGNEDHRLEIFLKIILSDIDQHKQNREKIFNTLPLHKIIHDDDIDAFQSTLSQNNFNINYNLNLFYYEQILNESKLSLIQIAAIYGSLKIFKFLWIQPNIIIDDSLIYYAIWGRNYEIIHICEGKCSSKLALQFSINSHQYEITNYIIENFPKDEIIQDTNSSDGNNYNVLNINFLSVALGSANYHIFLPCLRKVVKMMDNYDENSEEPRSDIFLITQNFDLDLYKFLYSHKNQRMNFDPLFLVSHSMIDAFKYILKDQNSSEIIELMEFALSNNNTYLKAILDYLIDSGIIKDEVINDEKIKEYINDDLLFNSCYFYDEDIIEKISSIIKISDSIDFCDCLIEATSTKFINSLFKRKLKFEPDSSEMYQLLLDEDLNEAAESLRSLNK